MPFDERDRIVHPMRRRQDGSGFDAITWDEAFGLRLPSVFWGLLTSAGPVRWA